MSNVSKLFLCSVAVAVLWAGVAEGALKHRWSFNSGDATDSAGSADGVASGDVTFDGTQAVLNTSGGARDGIIDLQPATIGISSLSAVTVEFWATPDSALNTSFSTTVGFGRVNTTDGSWAADYLIMQTHRGDNTSRGAIAISNDDSPFSEEDAVSGPELNDDAEHHYAVTVTNSELKWYVDGVLQGTSALDANDANDAVDAPNGLGSLANVAEEFAQIGAAYPIDQNWAGSMNELRIYDNHIINPSEIMASYNAGPDQVVIPEPASLALLGLGGLAMLRRRSA